jgi:hypothetical protein
VVEEEVSLPVAENSQEEEEAVVVVLLQLEAVVREAVEVVEGLWRY